MVSIVQVGDPILRAVAKPLTKEEIGSPKIKKILANMREALAAQSDGVAIAAPQIGESVRIFMVSGKALKVTDPEKYKDMPDELVLINPEIVRISKESQVLEEGCLSVRWIYGKVRRAKIVRVRALDAEGKVFERGASGILAQAFQHEIDHLDGILFIDKAFDLEEVIPPEEASRK